MTEKPAAVIIGSINVGFRSETANWNLARRAGGQVVRQIYVIVSALTRSVSFYGTRVENGTWHTIEFQAAYRHPSVGAVIDRPQKCDEFQNKVPLKGTFSPREM